MERAPAKRRAAFLDRDGVLNANCFYADTGCWESPRSLADFTVLPGVPASVARLHAAGFLLFLVSNQPNLLKRKTTPEVFRSMHRVLRSECHRAGARFTQTFYCFHHPSITGPCPCRKPSPYFLELAAGKHGLSLRESWMFGDRGVDLECGRAAGARTAWIDTGQENAAPERGLWDIRAKSLEAAVEQVLA